MLSRLSYGRSEIAWHKTWNVVSKSLALLLSTQQRHRAILINWARSCENGTYQIGDHRPCSHNKWNWAALWQNQQNAASTIQTGSCVLIPMVRRLICAFVVRVLLKQVYSWRGSNSTGQNLGQSFFHPLFIYPTLRRQFILLLSLVWVIGSGILDLANHRHLQ